MKEPSDTLKELIHEFAGQAIAFSKVKKSTKKLMDALIEQGEKEGLTVPELRVLVDTELVKRELSERQRLRILPAKLKRPYRRQEPPTKPELQERQETPQEILTDGSPAPAGEHTSVPNETGVTTDIPSGIEEAQEQQPDIDYPAELDAAQKEIERLRQELEAARKPGILLADNTKVIESIAEISNIAVNSGRKFRIMHDNVKVTGCELLY